MPQGFERLVDDVERVWQTGGRDGALFGIDVDGRLIGLCQIRNFNQTAHTAELGIAIGDKECWGREYGREAVALLLHSAFQYRNVSRVWLWCHARNERGISTYQACGFVEEGRLRRHVWSNGRYDDAVFMGVLRDEWQQRERTTES